MKPESFQDNFKVMITDIVREHELPLLRYAGSILQDSSSAGDIVQGTFLKYINLLAEQKEKVQNVRAWLYRVAYNLAIDDLRKSQTQARLQGKVQINLELKQSPYAAETVFKNELAQEAWQSLDQLTKLERTVTLMKIKEEKSYKEIAADLDISVSKEKGDRLRNPLFPKVNNQYSL